MHIPSTQTRTSHALSIKVLGQTIGFINGWNPTQSRTVTPIFEVGVDNSGNPVECMPGNVTGLNIAVNRFDIYKTRMEQVFGTPDLVMLTRQSEPFDVHEIWKSPGTSGVDERFIYVGCWFTSLGRTIRSDDNRIVNVTASLIYTKKIKSTGIVGGIANFSLPTIT